MEGKALELPCLENACNGCCGGGRLSVLNGSPEAPASMSLTSWISGCTMSCVLHPVTLIPSTEMFPPPGYEFCLGLGSTLAHVGLLPRNCPGITFNPLKIQPRPPLPLFAPIAQREHPVVVVCMI